jgi:L-threonylcarbamoyladenylate synthase
MADSTSDIATATTVDPQVAVAVLEAGGLVAIPTETVYGLAADADNPQAIRRVFGAKGRPADHPLIVHVADRAAVTGWVRSMPSAAETLAEACWPGPLTLLLPRAPRVHDSVTGGRESVGIRVPAHPLTTAVLQRLHGDGTANGGPGAGVVAPSANLFGHVSPTTAAHVVADLGGRIELILDGGPSAVGVESTIVDCTVDPPQILRSGGIDDETIAELLHGALAAPSGPRRASGMLQSHYAPRAQVLLADSLDHAEVLASIHSDAVVIDCDDLVRYARNVYGWLRAADDAHADTVIAVLPPATGLGHAIRDRLGKAAYRPTAG